MATSTTTTTSTTTANARRIATLALSKILFNPKKRQKISRRMTYSTEINPHELIGQGVLKKSHPEFLKGIQHERFFMLYRDIFTFSAREGSDIIGAIPLETIYSVQRTSDSSCSIGDYIFRITVSTGPGYDNRIFLLHASSNEECIEWVMRIRQAIEGVEPSGVNFIGKFWKKPEIIISKRDLLKVVSTTPPLNVDISARYRRRYCIISHQWSDGIFVEELDQGIDINKAWKKQSSMYTSVLFRSNNEGKDWKPIKKYGLCIDDQCEKILKVSHIYLPETPRVVGTPNFISEKHFVMGVLYYLPMEIFNLISKYADLVTQEAITEVISAGYFHTDYPHLPLAQTFNFNLEYYTNTDLPTKVLSVLLQQHHTVKTLKIQYSFVSWQGVQEICVGIKNNSTLNTIHLCRNKICDRGATLIAESLQINTTVSELKLNENLIGDSGAKAIGRALTKNSTLTKLELNANEIGDGGAKEIGIALKTNSTLTKLELYGNNIGDCGAKEIGSALKTNVTLTKLGLSYNEIGDYCARAIRNDVWGNELLNGN